MNSPTLEVRNSLQCLGCLGFASLLAAPGIPSRPLFGLGPLRRPLWPRPVLSGLHRATGNVHARKELEAPRSLGEGGAPSRCRPKQGKADSVSVNEARSVCPVPSSPLRREVAQFAAGITCCSCRSRSSPGKMQSRPQRADEARESFPPPECGRVTGSSAPSSFTCRKLVFTPKG